ncbi:hypothetical protein NIE88_17270 [Sporolactobacillus shoreicorticis]|uniref:DUF2207 domain-containing protein n=1 Tax=Sporolactobacillus shoreicorticis TaxID=1923877 RepID=A0ABW5S3J8_9BACL|nr:hypothetical protein [Sporolactobacillus shoreicorticis]MCO7127510.1 hypothetical protein [Sporolactobacillus shoreicorticis]
MSEDKKSNNIFVGYEYKEVTVSRDMESIYTDGYVNFGWVLDGTSTPLQGISSVTLKFKRNRKIRNKAELTRLQRQFDGCVAEVKAMERSKFVVSSIVVYTIGIIGTAFMAGSVFAYQGSLLVLSIILAVPGFVGWIIPYFCFSAIHKKKSARVTPIIDQKYDEIYELCEKANDLLPE